MKREAKVFILLSVILVSVCIPIHAVHAGQASATASVIIIIPPREAATQTMLVQEEKTQEQSTGEAELAYAKN